MEARNITRDRILGDAVGKAGTFFSRLRGLLGSRGIEAGGGLWLRPCNGIHSFGMRFAFDALFLNAGGRVVRLYRRFPRNRMSRIVWEAEGVLELPAGTIERTGTEVGDEIAFRA